MKDEKIVRQQNGYNHPFNDKQQVERGEVMQRQRGDRIDSDHHREGNRYDQVKQKCREGFAQCLNGRSGDLPLDWWDCGSGNVVNDRQSGQNR